MGILRPGGVSLTEYSLKKAGIKKGDKLLDIGCGDGTAAAFAKDKFGIEVTGIDTDKAAVEKANEKGIDAKVMDASMLEYPSYSFDVVSFECVFSVLERQEESIHEAYCVLKPGGAMIISDVYAREADMERFKKEYKEAMALFRRPRQDGDCEKQEVLPSPYCQDGAVVMEGLYHILDELEMELEVIEDHSEELKGFLGQAIMDYGSLDKYFEAEGTWKNCGCKRKDAGYFLVIARKKKKA